MYVAATVPVSKAKVKAKLDIHVVDSGFGALGHSSRWLGRAGVRAWFLSPQPPAGRRRILSGRSVERDVLETHPNPRLPPGPGNTASELGSGDHTKARSKCRSRWIRIPSWPVTSRSRSRSCSGQSCIAIDGSVISACWRSLGRG